MLRIKLAPKLSDFAKGTIQKIDMWFETVTQRMNVYSGVGDPIITELPPDQWVIYKNTTTGEIRIWVNDHGILKKSAALT
jgi:hypothetical protein